MYQYDSKSKAESKKSKASTVVKNKGYKNASTSIQENVWKDLNHTPELMQRTQQNNTGVPKPMKSRFEELSGFSFDDVKVHYNSDKPAQLQALAYTQGNQVYVAPGQEKHLGHELGHVVQQKLGIVKPTSIVNGIAINDDTRLERAADRAGNETISGQMPKPDGDTVQRMLDTNGALISTLSNLNTSLGLLAGYSEGVLSAADFPGIADLDSAIAGCDIKLDGKFKKRYIVDSIMLHAVKRPQMDADLIAALGEIPVDGKAGDAAKMMRSALFREPDWTNAILGNVDEHDASWGTKIKANIQGLPVNQLTKTKLIDAVDAPNQTFAGFKASLERNIQFIDPKSFLFETDQDEFVGRIPKKRNFEAPESFQRALDQLPYTIATDKQFTDVLLQEDAAHTDTEKRTPIKAGAVREALTARAFAAEEHLTSYKRSPIAELDFTGKDVGGNTVYFDPFNQPENPRYLLGESVTDEDKASFAYDTYLTHTLEKHKKAQTGGAHEYTGLQDITYAPFTLPHPTTGDLEIKAPIYEMTEILKMKPNQRIKVNSDAAAVFAHLTNVTPSWVVSFLIDLTPVADGFLNKQVSSLNKLKDYLPDPPKSTIYDINMTIKVNVNDTIITYLNQAQLLTAVSNYLLGRKTAIHDGFDGSVKEAKDIKVPLAEEFAKEHILVKKYYDFINNIIEAKFSEDSVSIGNLEEWELVRDDVRENVYSLIEETYGNKFYKLTYQNSNKGDVETIVNTVFSTKLVGIKQEKDSVKTLMDTVYPSDKDSLKMVLQSWRNYRKKNSLTAIDDQAVKRMAIEVFYRKSCRKCIAEVSFADLNLKLGVDKLENGKTYPAFFSNNIYYLVTAEKEITGSGTYVQDADIKLKGADGTVSLASTIGEKFSLWI